MSFSDPQHEHLPFHSDVKLLDGLRFGTLDIWAPGRDGLDFLDLIILIESGHFSFDSSRTDSEFPSYLLFSFPDSGSHKTD